MYKLPKELGEKILNYLANQPFIEVVDIMMELQKLEEFKELKDNKK